MKPEEAIFADALALEPPMRVEFLRRTCGADASLRRRVEDLLSGYDEAGAFLDRLPVTEINLARDNDDAEKEYAAGARIGRYKLLECIGEGGHGSVFVAEQETPVRRRVALKVIKLGMDTREVIARFEAERQALALMDHPNIARVLDAGATERGRPYFVMELVRGVPITRHCDEHKLDTAERLKLFTAVCSAVQHAHQKGIIHRDLKPSNILVTLHDGVPVPKIIDFGIAKAMHGRLTDRTIYTRFEQFVGTPTYMSPEQLEMSGLDIDTRSDIYSLGVVLYELLTGKPPFESKELLRSGLEEMRRTIREKEPPRPSAYVSTLEVGAGATIARQRGTDPARLRSWLRGDVDWIVMCCLEKDRTRRYETANALAIDLQHYLNDEPVSARPPSTLYTLRKFIRRHRVGVIATASIVSVVVVGSIATIVLTLRALRAERLQVELRAAAQHAAENEAAARRTAEQQQQRSAKIRWARETALPEINRLIQTDDIPAAFALAREAEGAIPEDPALLDLWSKIATDAAIETTPDGARVYAKPYQHPSADWEYIGTTPIAKVQLARAPYRYQIRKEGFETLNETDAGFMYDFSVGRRFTFKLVPVGSEEATPPGMVRAPGNAVDAMFTRLVAVKMDDYWIDTYEVTNRAFKAFVDAGGYATGKFWEQPFAAADGRVLAWSEAMALFHDSTGQPGPATWANGSYAKGKDDYPVTGVSWFEAAAYARFIGKRLPSIYHWRYAAPTKEAMHLARFSNFRGHGPVPVGESQGMNAHGTFDMAGNVKEWCSNEAGSGKRYILGGGWRDPVYMFGADDAAPPFDRSDQNGFRCVKLISDRPLDPRVDAPRVVERRDHSAEKPVGDAEFQAFKPLYAYDRTNLDPVVESSDDSHRHWRKEIVAFNAAYNGERMHAVVFLPNSSHPPYQTIVVFPGSDAQAVHSYKDELWEMPVIGPWIEYGRAVVYPILQSTYDRQVRTPAPEERVAWRELNIQLVKDVARTIDYLETRRDLDLEKLAYIGLSWGAWKGPVISALEPRFKVNVFVSGGLPNFGGLPEENPVNFAPRVTVPTLMVNGRYDYIFQYESSQIPLFNLLGTPPEHKRHVVFESGHIIPINPTDLEISAWLDHYLGPVK